MKYVIPHSALVAVIWFSASPLSQFFFYRFFYAARLQPALAWRGGRNKQFSLGEQQRGAALAGRARPVLGGGGPRGTRAEGLSAAFKPPAGRRGEPVGSGAAGCAWQRPGCMQVGMPGGAGRQPAVPGGLPGDARGSRRPCPGGELGAPGIRPAGRRGPALAGGGAAAAAAALPPRSVPSLPRLGRGNDLRGNLGRAGRERGRGGGARDAPAMPRRSEDPPGAAGRSVGLRPAPPALPGDTAGGWFPQDLPLPPSRGLFGMCRPRRGSPAGLGRGEAAAGVPGGLWWPRCPGREASRPWGFHVRLGGDGTGVPGG